MSPTADQVLQAALSLPYEERSEVAVRLCESVEGFASPEIAAAWNEEIARRLQEADEGRASYLTEEEFEQRMRDKYGPLAD